MKGKKFISLILSVALIISTFSGLTITTLAADAAYSWGFEDGTDGLAFSNDNLIKVEALNAGQSKTEAASPSGQVLYIGSKDTTSTGNAYVTLPKDAFVDESGKIKDEFQVSFDINSTDNGWRYAFYVGDGTTANSLYFVPAGAVVGGTKPVYGTRTEVCGKNATKDSRVMTLNKWVHIDIIKKGSTFVAYEDGERFGVLDNDAVAALSGNADQMFAAMGYSPHNDPGLNAYIDNLTIYNTADEQLLNRTKTIYYCYWDTETTGTKSQAGTASSTEVYSDKGGQRFLIEADGDFSGLDSVSISNGWDSTNGNTCTINVYALTEKPSNLDSADLQNPVGTFVQSKDFDWGYLTNEVLITGEIPAGAKYLVVTQENSGGGSTRVYAEYICLSYKEKEPQPQITVNYIDETLDGFTTGGEYVITADGSVNDTETISEGTTLSIKDTYFGKTIEIVKKGGDGTIDSEAQTLTVKARPVAPEGLEGVAPTTSGGKGSITGITDAMEYRAKTADNSSAWAAYPAEGVESGEYEVRTKATSSDFASASCTVTVPQYTTPSAEPSAEPTSEPSAEPSAEPTSEPSAEPTGKPTSEPPAESDKDYSKRLFYANFDEGTIAAVEGKITNSGATVTEDNGNKVANLGGSAHMAIAKADDSPVLKGLETAAIHMRAKATGPNKTDWYFFAAENATAPSGGSEKYIGAFNDSAGVINFERYKGGRGNTGVTVTSTKNEWHDLDFLFNEKTMEIYVDGEFRKAQSHDDVKLSDILGSANTQIFYIGKATWGSGEYMTGMVDDISVYGIAPIIDVENKSITDTLTLPEAADGAGYSIKWTSDNTDVIRIDASGAATVTKPAMDTAVKLTAEVTYGDIKISKDITVTVQGQTALTVTVDSDVADNVTVDKTEAHLGDEISVNVTAPEGKVIKDVKAGGTSILTSGRKGAYKFNMPLTSVTVTAEFEDKKQTAQFHFEDNTADQITYLQNGSAGSMEFVAGKTGNALKLAPNAKNGYYGKLDKFPLALSFSVGAWIKPADMNTWWQRVFDFGVGEGNSIFVTTLGETPNSGTTGTYRVDAFGAGIDSPKKLTANEWAYITVTYDEASDILTLYLNGEAVGTATCTKNMAEAYSGTANYIGKSQYAADSLYNGLIDEMVIYNYAITADEIQKLMGTVTTPTATPVVTDAPTSVPTSTPTSAPTNVPTSIPTSTPTAEPTSAPTSIPTSVPTSTPTDVPTSAPTSTPTDVPTSIPTDAPTSAPTSTPTDVPTSTPTSAPTSAPTNVPTSAPTAEPTSAPTNTPTGVPTTKPSSAPKYSISGTVSTADNTAAPDIRLTLKPLNKETTTNVNGEYAFSDVKAGVYNLIVEYGNKTITMFIKVENKDVVIDVNLPSTDVSSALEVKGEDTPDIVVGGLDKLADEIAKDAGQDAVVEVKMTVESKPEKADDPAQKAIKEKSGDSKLSYIDIAIVKTVNEEPEVEISATTDLITIVIPFVTEGRSNIKVYRYHDGEAQSMSSGGSGERYEVGDGFITIYSKNFSTYAIAYDEQPQPSAEPTTKPSQGSTGGGVAHSSGGTRTTPNPKPTTTPEATAKPVSSEAPTESGEPTDIPQSTDKPIGGTLPFADVNSSDWFYDAVKSAYEDGLMNGVTDTEFSPGMTLTRGMLATILGRMDGASQMMETNEYTDIDQNAYYAPYVAWGTANGILNGFGDGTFRPDEAVTREQTAKIIKSYYDFKGEGPVGAWAIRLDYSDTDQISDWATEGVMFCAMKGIMSGRENGTFDPKANITRAEFAATISRME